jgi:uncharacterized protein with FMN-binding domain
MAKKQPQQTFNLSRTINKFFLSGFVVFAFIAYVINQRFTRPDSALNPAPANSGIVTPQVLSSSGANSSLPAQPTLASQSSVSASNQGTYKDGTYTGPQVDAYYGIVEVQVTIQNGKMSDVQFLQYPSDRRTSVQINTIAMPYLQQEAIQAQSAYVNIISGATFTSEGFATSLNAALNSAKN